MYDTLLFTVQNHIARVSINRPELHNSIVWDVSREIEKAMQQCSADPEIRAVILTGEGKDFSAGGDVHRFKKLLDEGKGLPPDGMRLSGAAAYAVRTCDKPVVCRVNGAAAGAGSALAFASDFRIVTERTKFVGAFVKMGFCGDTGGFYYLSRLAGTAFATEFYMLGAPLRGADAFQMGLANRLCSDEELDDVTYELAGRLANSPTQAITCQKRMMNQMFYADIPVLTEMERAGMQHCEVTEDHREAVMAFLEKRKPSFTGR